MKRTWKEAKLHTMQVQYGGCIEDFKGYDDDRKVYIHTYNAIMKAIQSLPDEPDNYVKVAMFYAMTKDKARLDRIQAQFTD